MARQTPTTSTLAALIARAVTGGGGAGADDTEDRILDAAMTEVAARGTKATTMDDVAATAGVARMTVFRRFGSKTSLLERLVLRELRAFLERVDRALDAVDDPAESVAEAFVQCVRAGSGHPLVARLVRHEPAATFARLATGDPSPLELGRLYVAARIRADLPADTLREDPDVIADVLVRLAATYVLVPSVAVDVSDEDAAREFARRVLAPLVT